MAVAPSKETIIKDRARERRIWELLTQDFYWDVPKSHPVTVCEDAGVRSGPVRLQIFEMAVATVLAHMRPDFVWCVTPNRPDEGLDFLGVHRFIDDNTLGIHAAITVGGQCKKRSTVKDVTDEVAGSLIKMARAKNPTFFVVALSARIARSRVDRASEDLTKELRRQCHILDRTQIEGLMAEHLDAVTEILREGLSGPEVTEVVKYFKTLSGLALPPTMNASLPRSVHAGLPFSADVTVRWTRASNPAARLWWRPKLDGVATDAVTLIGPIGADAPSGVTLSSGTPGGDPLSAERSMELVTYAVGDVDLGEIVIGIDHVDSDSSQRIALGRVNAVEMMRPRFYARPYRAALIRLADVYNQAVVGGVASVGVVGAGGSGKSRMCEEFALEKRRRGSVVITAKHAKTHEEPQRILAELLAALAVTHQSVEDPAENVVQTVARYDPALASSAAPTIRSVFGTASPATDVTDQSMVSVLLLLIMAHRRQVPLIVHLQDLHWASADVLSLLEHLVRRLGQVTRPEGFDGPRDSGVLFLFEGRTRESGESAGESWSSAPFEAFLARVDGVMVTCSSFSPEDAISFTRLLFEARHSAHRVLADELLQSQEELSDQICRTAGGNPFHTLEQIRLLKEREVICQNPRTGLLYASGRQLTGSMLPDSVFAAIRLRWQYMRERAPDLALLVWGSALLDDQISGPLFGRLWRELAPRVSLRDVDATEMLWTADGSARDVVFRHENYFESIRRFTVPESDRRRVVDAYCSWYSQLQTPHAAELFAWARALLELPDPDHIRANKLLTSALSSSRRSGDPHLTRRILAFYLNLVWDINELAPIATTKFLRHCDQERDLCRELLGTDREQAAIRIARLCECIKGRVSAASDRVSAKTRDGLALRLLTAEALHAQLLFNDRHPTESADIARHVVESVRVQRLKLSDDPRWELLEMESLYTQSCAQAISGDFPSAVRSSATAARLARGSKSLLARKVLSTYGTMLLSEDPELGEAVLRECLALWTDDESSDAALVHVHLSMALVLQAYRSGSRASRRQKMLGEAATRMTRVHDACRRLGLYPDAGAAALVRGVVSALSDDGDDVAWFAQGVAAAARGRQMETLWRSHINLAAGLCRKEQAVSPTARDHAHAALEILQDTLSGYSEPERSPRFQMVQVGMAEAVWILLESEDEAGFAILERYPTLRTYFSDPAAGVLAPYDGGPRHYQWLRAGGVDYILY